MHNRTLGPFSVANNRAFGPYLVSPALPSPWPGPFGRLDRASRLPSRLSVRLDPFWPVAIRPPSSSWTGRWTAFRARTAHWRPQIWICTRPQKHCATRTWRWRAVSSRQTTITACPRWPGVVCGCSSNVALGVECFWVGVSRARPLHIFTACTPVNQVMKGNAPSKP
jgi:hypothetical protein